MSDIDTYSRRYLEQWDKRATLRTRPRYRMSAAEAVGYVYPIATQPLARHPAVSGRGREAVHELLVRTALQWQTALAIIEVDPIADLCGKLANGVVRYWLPESARQVALTIATDEMYHAYTARESNAQVTRLTGIEAPLANASTTLVQALKYVRQNAPPDLRGEAETMVLCFAENFVTEELFGFSMDGNAQNPFYVIIREHLMDEGRHQKFFRELLTHLWAGIDDDARSQLGCLLPGFFDTFLGDFDHFLEMRVELLLFLGFDRNTCCTIAEEAYAAQYGPAPAHKGEMKFVQHCLDLVGRARMLDNAATREALIASGWVIPKSMATL
jgi:hypothetical protein